MNKLQQEIEGIEKIYVDFKARIEYSKEMQKFEGKPITAFNHPKSEKQIRTDLQKNVFNHRETRIKEQGIATAEIMKEIAEYKAVELSGRRSEDYYVRKFEELNKKVSMKTEYLERKLSFLQEHKEISGNAESILQL